ncbi:MAG: sulfotransferase [Chloroflexota bacterium]|nr:sulfotransferase [Chloroflexota bacterium]
MFLICGSGRSGTSVVALVLHDAGIAMGRDLIEADASNTEGYFEERPVVALNDAILNDVGLDHWFATATRGQILDAAVARHDLMRALAAEATAGWKDPRFCWTLEAWLEVLAERPRVIVCIRSPVEVVESTLRYYALDSHDARRAAEHTWRCEYERLLEIIDAYGLDAISIDYAALCADPVVALAPLARFTGRELDASGVRPDLRHHAARIPEEFEDLYGRITALGGASDATRDAGAPSASGPSRS